MRRFLFVGNGFDVAHNKPTKYMDFLYACAKITNKRYEYKPQDDYLPLLEEYTNLFITRYKDDKQIIDCINSNFYINYFLNKFDFEKRIGLILKKKLKIFVKRALLTDN